MMKINGKEIAREIIEDLGHQDKPDKILAAILVGEEPTSISFLKKKEEVANMLKIDFRLYRYGSDLTNDDLRKEVGRISKQKRVGGVIVQLPLPESVNAHYVVNAIPPSKDVDVLGERALGALYNNRSTILPPAVDAVNEILKRQGIKLSETKVAVVGLGTLVGKPISTWLSGKCSELNLMDNKSDQKMLKNYNIVISGVGKSGVVKLSNLKDGAGVIDFGYYYSPQGKVSGDLEEGDVSKLSFYTPTPGGTGPILVASLFRNFYLLNK